MKKLDIEVIKMIYYTLNHEGRIIVPFLFTVFFLFMYSKNRKTKNFPVKMLLSNLINAIGCIFC